MWSVDHKNFIPGLMKVQVLFALQLYLFTGARVGSFMPSDQHKKERGLRYEVSKLGMECYSVLTFDISTSSLYYFPRLLLRGKSDGG